MIGRYDSGLAVSHPHSWCAEPSDIMSLLGALASAQHFAALFAHTRCASCVPLEVHED